MVQEGQKKTVLDTIKEQLATIMETLEAHGKAIEDLKKRAPKKQLFGGKSERRAIVDTKTGKTYVSLSAMGKALAGEADTAPDDHFAYYKLQAKFPDRFRDATEEEAAVAEAEEEARVAEALAKAEAEEAARPAAPAKSAKPKK